MPSSSSCSSLPWSPSSADDVALGLDSDALRGREWCSPGCECTTGVSGMVMARLRSDCGIVQSCKASGSDFMFSYVLALSSPSLSPVGGRNEVMIRCKSALNRRVTVTADWAGAGEEVRCCFTSSTSSSPLVCFSPSPRQSSPLTNVSKIPHQLPDIHDI